MPHEAISLIRTAKFRSSIHETLPKNQAYSSARILDWLISLSDSDQLNLFEVPLLKGTSALDLGFILLFVELLGDDSKSENMASIFGVTSLCCKKWIRRLRDEGMCEVDWTTPEVRLFGNIGKYEVNNWGIFNREVYLPFVPYVTMAINNWKKTLDVKSKSS